MSDSDVYRGKLFLHGFCHATYKRHVEKGLTIYRCEVWYIFLAKYMSEIADRILGIMAAGIVDTTVVFNGEMFVDFRCEFVR